MMCKVIESRCSYDDVANPLRGGGGRGIPTYQLNKHVWHQKVSLFLNRFGLKKGVDFTEMGTDSRNQV